MTASVLPITGWWPDINVGFTLAVPPSLGPSAFVPRGIDVSVPPSLAFTGALVQPAAFTLSVAPSLAGTTAVVAPGAFGLSLPPSLAFTGAPVQPGAFTLSVPPSLTPSGVPVEAGAFGLSLPPSLAFTGAPIPGYDNSALSSHQSALASGTPFTLSATGTAGDYAIVGIFGAANAAGPHSGTAVVTINGQTMTSLGFVYANNSTTAQYMWVFGYNDAGLNALNTGSNTVSVTLTQAAATFTGRAAAELYGGVSSVGTLHTAFGNSASPSVSVTAAASTDLVWGAIVAGGSTLGSFSLTTRQHDTANQPEFFSGDTPGSATVSGTITSAAWAAAGLDIQ